jgi:hypothetical protein
LATVARARYDISREAPNATITRIIAKNNASTHIAILTDNDGTTHTDQISISNAIYNSYKNLFSTRDTSSSAFADLAQYTSTSISAEQAAASEKAVNVQDVLTAIQRLKKSKSPGPDGLTAEFYISFANVLAPALSRAINDVLNNGDPTNVFAQGTIIMIPKKVSHITHLNHIRPITLLNTDYKIASHILANRIQPTLHRIIHSDQTGYVKGRRILDNLWAIQSLCELHSGEDALHLYLDFSKAFDLMQHIFINDALLHFGFTPCFIKYIKNLTQNTTSRIQIGKTNRGYPRVF